eukprot:TRINITY_DN2291_c0_g1_i1.p1 TRINITY_DN2291_c0_g1~~TRINITY_DN2291_c0_g1_i1.p1  ORF type:complete len:379 (+),score=71.57 TRINITY_DN2291_c0_g1_i1:41-1177(+)
MGEEEVLLDPYLSCDPNYPTSNYDAGQCLAFHVVWIILNCILWIWATLDLVFIFVYRIKWNISHTMVVFVLVSLSIQILRLALITPEDRHVNQMFLAFLYSYWLFFTFLAYCILVFWWGQLYHTSVGLRITLLRKVKIILITITGIVFVLFSVVSVLQVETTGSLPTYLRIIYAVFTIAIALAFMIYGGRLLMMLKSQLNTHAPQEKKTKIKAIFIWTTAVSVTFIVVAIFQLATRFDRSTTINAFIMRHSIYNSCNLIGTFFIILSFGGLRFWKNPKKLKTSDQSTKKISKNSKNSGKSESARDLKHSSTEIPDGSASDEQRSSVPSTNEIELTHRRGEDSQIEITISHDDDLVSNQDADAHQHDDHPILDDNKPVQ